MTTTSTDEHGAWRQFVCLACGYVYDEKLADPENGLAAGTRFEYLPKDWQCPLCGVHKDDFRPHEEVSHATSTARFSPERGVVIIGGGLAGWAMVDALRALDKDIAITLISGDSADRYHKPMLSVSISQNKGRDELVRTQAVRSASDNNVRLLPHTLVTHIDTQNQSLSTTHGMVHYDKLILAVGASPIYPPSIPKEMAWDVNHLDSFTKLQSRLSIPKHIAIIGAGMIGVEMSEDLIKAGHQVSLIDIQMLPLSALLPAVAGERVLDAIKSLGVSWFGGHMVKEVRAIHEGYEIVLLEADTQTTSSLIAHEIIIATGLVVSEHLPTLANLSFDKHTGIRVNPQTLQTNLDNIYALGDCISINGTPCRYVAPHRSQAATIAEQILPQVGQSSIYNHTPPMIRLKNKCISITANGTPKGMGDWRILCHDEKQLMLEMHENGQIVAQATIKSVG